MLKKNLANTAHAITEWGLSESLRALREQLELPVVESVSFAELVMLCDERHMKLSAHCALFARCSSSTCICARVTKSEVIRTVVGANVLEEMWRLVIPIPQLPHCAHYVTLHSKLAHNIVPQWETCPSILVRELSDTDNKDSLRLLSFKCCFPPTVPDHHAFLRHCRRRMQ
jgi:hypothetical protein